MIAPLVATQAVPIMRAQGSGTIVNISSGIAFGAMPGSGAYAGTKYGLEKLTDTDPRDRPGRGGSGMFPAMARRAFLVTR